MSKKLNCILLVDDNEADNNYHRIIIEEAGVTERIAIVENGQEALDYLTNKRNESPDLILLDINMPRMNGWEFLDAYRNLQEKPKALVIVMVTTSQNPEDKKRASGMKEVYGFRVKPLTAEDISAIVNTCFGESTKVG